jgi:hypothetical protein
MKKEIVFIGVILALCAFSGCAKKNQELSLDRITGEGDQAKSSMGAREKTAEIKAGQIPKAEGGYTVEECYTLRYALEGKTVKVRGKVVKYNPRIMNRNWIHIQDGTGGDSMYDLTLTAPPEVTTDIGKVILVSGIISYDKTFGESLDYPVIIENCGILEEK